MLYVNYQISTTFFDSHIEVKQKSDQVRNIYEANRLLRALKSEYIPYKHPQKWKKHHIFSVRILMTVDGKRYFDYTINIIQLDYLIQWNKINLQKQNAGDEFTRYRLSNIQKQLEKQFQQASEQTLEEFLIGEIGDLNEGNK